MEYDFGPNRDSANREDTAHHRSTTAIEKGDDECMMRVGKSETDPLSLEPPSPWLRAWKTRIFDPCRSETHENFITIVKLGILITS